VFISPIIIPSYVINTNESYLKSEIRIPKLETNSKNNQNLKKFETFEFVIFDIVSKFACLREAASAKAGISCFEFQSH